MNSDGTCSACRSSRAWHLLAALFGCLVISIIAGCSGGARVRAGDADSLTNGLALRLFVSDRETSHALYEVQPDGTISFAGGWNAINARPSWSGSITASDAAALHALLEEHGWLAGEPVADNPADPRTHRVDLAWPGGGQRWETRTGGTHIDPVREFLETLAAKRFERVLQQLPEPGRMD